MLEHGPLLEHRTLHILIQASIISMQAQDRLNALMQLELQLALEVHIGTQLLFNVSYAQLAIFALAPNQ